MSELVHVPCGARAEFVGDPNHPPDPDRWGNRRSPYKCVACGDRTTVTHPKHGGALYEFGYAPADEIDWLVPLS